MNRSIKVIVLLAVISAALAPVWAANIHRAAGRGNVEMIKAILAEDPAAKDARDHKGSTPLHEAAFRGQIKAVKLLIGKRADVNSKNNDGKTPLHLACQANRKEIAKLLLSKGADKNLADTRFKYTPLHWAAFGGSTDAAELLLAKGLDASAKTIRGAAPLHLAASGGHCKVIELLASRGVDLEARADDECTPLFWAAWNGRTRAVKTLLEKGANLRATTETGWTPLHSAAQQGKKDVAELLLKKGISKEVTNDEGETPLFVAMMHGQESMVEFFLEKGVEVNCKDEDGITPIFHAIYGRRDRLVPLFLEHGADLNYRNSRGNTALHAAVNTNNPALAKLFLEKGADAAIQNIEGETPLARAVLRGNDEIISTLLKCDAPVNSKESHYGRTPLHVAAIKGSTKIVRQLLDKGAKVNATDMSGKTPLHYACKYAHKGVATALKAKGAKAVEFKGGFGPSTLLAKNLKHGEAVMWYLGHCGWAIKTSNHLLIFDYWKREGGPDRPCLANGHICPSEIGDQNVSVFATHEHGDHYDEHILDWKGKVKNLTYVFGFRPEATEQHRENRYNGPVYEYVGPREHKTLKGLEITTIEANDAGVGFLVKVDGLTVYHAGDHAGWRENQKEGFTREIDFLADHVKGVDFAFLNITGCHVQDQVALAEGTAYTLGKLKPKFMVPTHGGDREYVYRAYAVEAEKKKCPCVILCPENRGDHFTYKNGQIY